MSFDPNYLRPNKTISRPLIYPTISGQGTYTNVLLIDNQVTDYQQMVDSVNASTFPIVYSVYSQKNELLALLQANFITIERLGLCFTFGKTKKFFDNQPLFSKNETQPYSENVQFILNLITQFQIKNIDYLACNTLNYANWEAYYDLLKQNTTAVIGASSDKTGNIQYGGDWMLESTSQDVEFIYFSTTIKYYQYLLDNPSWANAAEQELDGPTALVIDPTNTYLYVCHIDSIVIERILLSNPSIYVNYWCIVEGGESGIISSLVIDSTNTYMYALTYDLFRISIENPAEIVKIKTGITQANSFMVIDNTDTYLYFSTYYSGFVSRITISDEEYIENWSNFTEEFINGMGCSGIAIDPTNTYIYISRYGGVDPSNCITQILVSDPNITTPIWTAGAYDFDELYNYGNMIIDSQNNYLYAITNNNTITKISISNPTTDFITFATSANGLKNIPFGITADISNNYMYISNFNDYEGSNDLNGTISQISFPPPPPPSLQHPTLITIDPTNTYAYVVSNNMIFRISIADPTNYIENWLVDVSNSYSGINDFVIDSTNTYMYLSCNNFISTSEDYYYIFKIPINNPSGYTIFKTLSGNSFITLDSTDTYIYVGFENVISKISLSDPNGDYVPNWATSAQGLYYIQSLKIDPINAYIYADNIKAVNSILTRIKTRISITNPTNDYTAEWHTSSLNVYGTFFAIDSYNTYIYECNQIFNSVTQISILDPSNSIIYADDTTQNLNFNLGIALDPPNTYMYVTNYSGGGNFFGTISQISLPLQPSPNNNPCFLHDTKILTDKGYVEIQSLRKGDRIQTLRHGFVPIDMIGFKYMYHPAQKERIADQLYKYSSATHPEIFEDLVITGCHSILIEEFTDSKQRDKTNEVLGDIFITDDKYRLPACVDENSKIYETPGKYIIYHFALEHEDYYMNYGVFANGLLVETTSKRYMKELSNMTLFP